MAFRDNIGKVALKLQSERRIMGLVKTRRLAAMQKQQRAKAGMKLPKPKPARKCAPFPQQPSKPPHTKSLLPNL